VCSSDLGLTFDLLWHFTDVSEAHAMQITNSVLHHQKLAAADAKPQAQASLTLTRAVLLALFAGAADLPGLIQSGALQISGDIPALRQFFTLFDRPDAQFGIVLP
jgi:alkyl sulfatase BDS1-like metallo-beta-lactamase superfamily hydrolase